MEIRYATHPDHVKTMDTEELRKHFLVEDLFVDNTLKMVYSHVDRIIAGGIVPVAKEIELQGTDEIRAEYFLQRREIGLINIGGKGTVIVDGKDYVVDNKECLYVGMGSKKLVFRSAEGKAPAKFYFNSVPAHASYETVKCSVEQANQLHLGSQEKSNLRTIYQFIHPQGIKSCQLVMGYTVLAPGNVWNTMPCHLHDRRMEVYLYTDFPDDERVFHYMGEPKETRHIVMRKDQAVISPSWSIHSGVGTAAYTFIWGMAGENQVFGDMDAVKISDLR